MLPPFWLQHGKRSLQLTDLLQSRLRRPTSRPTLGSCSFFCLPQDFSCSNLLGFLEFLYQNNLSPKVIRNYLSSLLSLCSLYRIPCDSHHPAVARFIRSLSINSHFRPTPRGALTSLPFTIFLELVIF